MCDRLPAERSGRQDARPTNPDDCVTISLTRDGREYNPTRLPQAQPTGITLP